MSVSKVCIAGSASPHNSRVDDLSRQPLLMRAAPGLIDMPAVPQRTASLSYSTDDITAEHLHQPSGNRIPPSYYRTTSLYQTLYQTQTQRKQSVTDYPHTIHTCPLSWEM